MKTNEQFENSEEIKEIIPRVFISYSWSTEEHKEWVLELAKRLVSDIGVEVILDRWHAVVGHDRFKFMEKSITEADKVIVICDKLYCEKADGRQGGVGAESMIFTPDLYENTEQTKIIPVALEKNTNGSYILPTFFKSRFIQPMTLEDDFEKSLIELGRLIWEEPAETPPPIGKKPDFNQMNISSDDNSTIIREADEETVLWLLPRGFLIFSDITYSKHSSWSVTANYYDYNGNWYHGTHYHDSYRDSWDRNIINQFQKLSIPIGDWHHAYAPLNFLMKLRETDEVLDIKSLVEEKTSYDYYVKYYQIGEKISLPKIPSEYLFFNKSGEIRDIINNLQNIKVEKLDNPVNEVSSIRHRAYLEAYKYFGEKHPSLRFINEVIDGFNAEFDLWDLKNWCNKLKDTLSTALYS